jgi:hypothetical protein
MDVTDQIQQSSETRGDVALGAAHVIAVEHEPEVVFSDGLDDLLGLIGCAEEVARRVVAVERLDEDDHALLRGGVAGVAQVGDKRFESLGAGS